MRKIIWLSLIGLLFFSLDCGRQDTENRLLCYTSVPLGIMTEIKKEFEAKYPRVHLDVEDLSEEDVEPMDVDIKVYREGSGHVIAKLAAEQETGGGIKADLLWIAEPSYYYHLKDRKLLSSYTSTWNDQISEQFKDNDHTFWGARVFAMVIIYNTTEVENPPTTWAELTDPKWNGEICVANPSYSGATLLWAGALSKKFSWEYLKSLRDNNMAVVKGNSVVAAKVSTGEFNLGITIHNIAMEMKSSGSSIDLVYPTDGAVMIVSPIAIFADSERQELAQTFLDYILSQEGQRIVVEKGNFIPVRTDVAPPPNTPTMDELLKNALDTSWAEDLDKVNAIKNQFQQVVMLE